MVLIESRRWRTAWFSRCDGKVGVVMGMSEIMIKPLPENKTLALGSLALTERGLGRLELKIAGNEQFSQPGGVRWGCVLPLIARVCAL